MSTDSDQRTVIAALQKFGRGDIADVMADGPAIDWQTRAVEAANLLRIYRRRLRLPSVKGKLEFQTRTLVANLEHRADASVHVVPMALNAGVGALLFVDAQTLSILGVVDTVG